MDLRGARISHTSLSLLRQEEQIRRRIFLICIHLNFTSRDSSFVVFTCITINFTTTTMVYSLYAEIRETPARESHHQADMNRIKEYFDSMDYHGHPFLANKHTRGVLKQAMELVYPKETILFCIDIEAWERNNNEVTEIGIAIYDPSEQVHATNPLIKSIHIVIQENQHKKNGRYVPEHSLNFNGGKTYVMPKVEAIDFTQLLISHYYGFVQPCYLVGHDISGDLKWLHKLGLELPVRQILDTQSIFACSHGKQGASLRNALRAVNQPYAYLHNAGNDAYYTLLLALSLCDPFARRLNHLDDHEIQARTIKAPKSLRHNVSERKYVTCSEAFKDLFPSTRKSKNQV